MMERIFETLKKVPFFKKILENPAVEKILNRETVMYLIVGVLTTLWDYLVFAVSNELLKGAGMDAVNSSSIATAIAWFFAVLFAFFADKHFVFLKRDYSLKTLSRELPSFFGARIFSGITVLFLMRLLVGLGMNEYLAKILTSVIDVIFNYIASKLFIFKKK